MRSICYGCALVTPRQAPADIWHDLTAFETCVRLAAERLAAAPRRIALNWPRANRAMSPPRKRADVLLVERGLFESRARARAAIEAGLVIGQRQAGRKSLRDHSRRRRAAGAARASLCLARRRQAGGRAGAVSDRHRGSRLSRRRRIDRRLHRSAARQRRQPGVLDRCRARAVASVAARPSQDRLDGRDRHPRASKASGCRCGRTSSSSTSASFR